MKTRNLTGLGSNSPLLTFSMPFCRGIIAFLLFVTLPMCKKVEIAKDEPIQALPANKAYHDQLKRQFGRALARVMSTEPGVRELLKKEALKQFNKEYDVLYQMVKNQPVRNDGKTFAQVLSQAAQVSDSPSSRTESSQIPALLDQIDKELPLLTILVPELPEKSFSAESNYADAYSRSANMG